MGMTSKKTESQRSNSITAAADPLAGTALPDDEHDVETDEELAAQCRFDDAGPDDASDGAASEAPDESPVSDVDAEQIQLAELQHRLPPATEGRAAKFQVIFQPRVLDEIHRHGKSNTEVELCGVLVGNVYEDGSPYVLVEASIRGNAAVSKGTQVTFTSETWSRIHEELERDYPKCRIVGWYHTHPGFGIFLSGMDLFIQDHFFNAPWQVAFVYDPIGGDEGVFIWRGGKSVREPHLIAAGPDSARGGWISRLMRKLFGS